MLGWCKSAVFELSIFLLVTSSGKVWLMQERKEHTQLRRRAWTVCHIWTTAANTFLPFCTTRKHYMNINIWKMLISENIVCSSINRNFLDDATFEGKCLFVHHSLKMFIKLISSTSRTRCFAYKTDINHCSEVIFTHGKLIEVNEIFMSKLEPYYGSDLDNCTLVQVKTFWRSPKLLWAQRD